MTASSNGVYFWAARETKFEESASLLDSNRFDDRVQKPETPKHAYTKRAYYLTNNTQQHPNGGDATSIPQESASGGNRIQRATDENHRVLFCFTNCGVDRQFHG